MVASNIKSAHVFKKYGIDFCCNGGISIEKACERKAVNLDMLLNELRHIDDNALPSQDFNHWSPEFLAEYIVQTHHRYVRESLPLIEAYASKVARVHGASYPPVVEIHTLFREVAQELLSHMEKEERVLFPYISRLLAARRDSRPPEAPPFGKVHNPIRLMEHEHESVGRLFERIAALSERYTPPTWACNTFKALYAKLAEFEADLHWHIHLENHILFPKAIELESA